MKPLLAQTLLILGTGSSVAWMLPAPSHSKHLPGSGTLDPLGSVELSDPISWTDVDGDGRLEIFTVRQDGSAALIRETADGRLEDCTAELGLAGLPPIARALWEDVDGDDAPDLLVVARDGSVRLLENEPGRGFRDATLGSGLELVAGIAEAGWRDVDRDGRIDLVFLTLDGMRLHRGLGAFHFDEARLQLEPGSASGFTAGPLGSPSSALEDLEGTATTGPARAGEVRRPTVGRDRGRVAVEGLPASGSSTQALPFEAGGLGTNPGYAPMLASAACAKTLVDQATMNCIKASSKPQIGMLYPISADLFVDSSTGHVGINSTNPIARLEIDSVGSLGLRVSTTLTGGTPVKFASLNSDPLRPTMMATVADGGVAGFFQQSVAVGSLFTGLPSIKGTLGIDSSDNAELRLSQSTAIETVELLAAEAPGNGAQLDLRTSFGQSTITLDAETGTSAGEISMFDVEGNETVQIRSESSVTGSGGQIALRKDDGTNTIVMEAAANQGSEFSMRNAAGLETVEILSEEAAGNGSQLRMYRGSGFPSIVIDAEQGLAGQVSFYNSNQIETIEMVAEEVANDGAQIILKKYDGTPSITLDASQGADGRITTETLEITGGADLVEAFDASEDCRPGSVVALDPATPGALGLADQPYDPCVVGIVSGGGDVRPGLQLGQRDVLDGDTLVALSGRVYVRCSDENGAVRPGDLLTSSSTPGHAMRASDPTRAFGAVIGKALEPLEGESGLVLVLVGLQ